MKEPRCMRIPPSAHLDEKRWVKQSATRHYNAFTLPHEAEKTDKRACTIREDSLPKGDENGGGQREHLHYPKGKGLMLDKERNK